MEPVTIRNSILTHEHVLVDFIGAAEVSRSRYDLEEAFAAARPKVEAVKKYGCRRILECTPAYIGRDPRLLLRLQEATGVELWTNTGLYAAANHKFLPEYVKTETSLALAKRWVAEWRDGVEGMKPKFIKIGVNLAPLHEWDRKVVEAGAIASLETGLTVACHTSGGGEAAMETMEILTRRRLPLSKYVWVHAQNEMKNEYFEQAARAGAWVSFDGLSEKSDGRHWQAYFWMLNAGLLPRMLLSHDSGWYRVGEPRGGQFNGFTYAFEKFLPRVPAEFRELLMVTNPRRAFGD